jgi:hypothetical protein
MMEEEVKEEVVEDRRAAIEAAFEAAEPPKEVIDEKPVEPTPPVEESKPEAKDETTEEVKAAPAIPVDKAPTSWRAPQKAKWEALDPDIRQEVMRRERDITKTLGEVSQVRQFANQFSQMIQPFQERLREMKHTPLAAVEALLKTDKLLSSSSPTQRAQYMATLIKDYGVDIRELDNALSGSATTDPVTSQIDQLLSQRLAPLQEFIASQQAQRRAQEEQAASKVSQTVDQMAQDPAYPHFQDVKEDMADIIDLQAKKGVYITLAQAYNRAIAMNPELSEQMEAQRQVEASRKSAQLANARAQKALQASKSVSGAPTRSVAGASNASDRRALIEAAFDSAVDNR